MKQISLGLAGALVLIAGMSGFLIGQIETPEYRLSMYDKNAMDLGRADRGVDLRYLNAMIAHHRGAMLLAEQTKESKREEIRSLAKDILSGEPKLIAELYEWKKEWYDDERSVRDPIVAQLGAVNETFDLRFLNALIAHHEAGIEMTRDIRQKSSRTEVLDNADAVEDFLVKSGGLFKEWRKNWYGVE